MDSLIGHTFANWQIVSYSHKTAHPCRTTNHFWNARCTNCGHLIAKTVNNMSRGGCRNCYLKPKGESGLKRLFDRYRAQAEKFSRPFELSIAAFHALTSAPCYYCGAPPSRIETCNAYSPGKKSTWGSYVFNGVDRKDNELGYVLENCITCCHFCNRAKNSYGFDEYLSHMGRFAGDILGGRIPAGLQSVLIQRTVSPDSFLE